jgi:hypothetical protein
MSKLANLQARLRRINQQGEQTLVAVRTTVETVGAAAAAGYARGRFEDPADGNKYAVFDIDPEIVVGAPLLLAGFSGLLGSASPDALAVGNGVLGFYAGLQALDMGAKHRKEDVGSARGYTVSGRSMGPGGVSPMHAARQTQAA